MSDESNEALALAEDHWNVHTETYDTAWTVFRKADMNGLTDAIDMAAELLKTFVTETHMSGDGRPTKYAAADGEYRVRLFLIDPAILIEDELGDETLPDGFRPDGTPIAVATWKLEEKN